MRGEPSRRPPGPQGFDEPGARSAREPQEARETRSSGTRDAIRITYTTSHPIPSHPKLVGGPPHGCRDVWPLQECRDSCDPSARAGLRTRYLLPVQVRHCGVQWWPCIRDGSCFSPETGDAAKDQGSPYEPELGRVASADVLNGIGVAPKTRRCRWRMAKRRSRLPSMRPVRRGTSDRFVLTGIGVPPDASKP